MSGKPVLTQSTQTTKTQVRKQLSRLVRRGIRLMEPRGVDDLGVQEVREHIRSMSVFEYQKWYTEALSLVKQLSPERATEFQDLYDGGDQRQVIHLGNYSVKEYLDGLRLARLDGRHEVAIHSRIRQQTAILNAISHSVESLLADIEGNLRGSLFDSEIDEARYLAKNGHLRAAGAIAGVVLEGHLAAMCRSHDIIIQKPSPTIGDLNDALKAAEILTTESWRWVQYLGDLRNLCDHRRDREPTEDQVIELIDGVDKIIKAFF